MEADTMYSPYFREGITNPANSIKGNFRSEIGHIFPSNFGTVSRFAKKLLKMSCSGTGTTTLWDNRWYLTFFSKSSCTWAVFGELKKKKR